MVSINLMKHDFKSVSTAFGSILFECKCGAKCIDLEKPYQPEFGEWGYALAEECEEAELQISKYLYLKDKIK
jgi:hypothetical protein